MRRALVFAALALATAALGHPPVSVVIDSRGNVFYSDLERVWRVAPDGKRIVAVPNVHTHELSLDAQDNLFGEDSRYEGGERWSHALWKRDAAGRVSVVKPRTPGFSMDYGFARDRAGNLYWPRRDLGEIRKRAPNGVVTRVIGELKGMAWLHALPSGTLYVVDGGDLVRVQNGRAARIVRGIARKPFGIWNDAAENVYVADYESRTVKRVTPAGRVTVFLQTAAPWGPVGGAFARNGELWLLECSLTNQIRLRRLPNSSRAKTRDLR